MVGTERTFKRAGSIAKFTKPVCDEPQVLSLFRGRAEFWNGNSKIYYIVTRFNRSAAKPTKRMGSEVSSRPPSNNLRVESRVAGPGFWEMSALAIVILSDGKSRSTTAGNQEHGEVFVLGLFHDALDRMP